MDGMGLCAYVIVIDGKSTRYGYVLRRELRWQLELGGASAGVTASLFTNPSIHAE